MVFLVVTSICFLHARAAYEDHLTDNDGMDDLRALIREVIRDAARAGQRLVLGPAAVLTPLARDRARASGVQIEKER